MKSKKAMATQELIHWAIILICAAVALYLIGYFGGWWGPSMQILEDTGRGLTGIR